ncbi:tripartite tricarboxylate transporter TctB family protein [Pectobacteriaceae bacterium CE70]|nr:tripartite tricarboxylate transporter TctB family protein [Prodigiosinella sp. LS101]WJV58433.1 tripartite tricarboxylate transporter TctB family protein [Pectobacteriaceae bacterium C111]WJV62724.1 tripartite tricarboxylate transporter TctB family protein [Pectobacteriaceae bacterium C52]WJV67056.1 tripartite tricarboxylate transporter TctB family protein [Pectobacteriaceae bacterium CE70]WJY11040.1 tripartite tricarboxylate transporter TctB family protein [Pectobacteriaceae bacterium C80]
MKKTLISPVIFFAFGCFLLGYSQYVLRDIGNFGAGFMPAFVGVGIIIFSLLEFSIKAVKKSRSLPNKTMTITGSVIVITPIIFYLLFVDYLGFIITTSIILFSLMLKFIKTHRIWMTILAIVFSSLIYLLFAKVLLVALPAGKLF